MSAQIADNFTIWANNYLELIYHRVITKWGTPHLDDSIWCCLVNCGKEVKSDVDFYNLNKYTVNGPEEIALDNKVFAPFLPLLIAIYDSQVKKEPECVGSIMDIKPEELIVPIDPVVAKERIKESGFDKEVEEFLASGKYTWKTASAISHKLKISVQNFEDWVKGREDVAFKKSDTVGVILYALKSRLAIPAFGTDDFAKHILTILEDPSDKKPWKSGEYLCKASFQDDLELFVSWLDGRPEVVRRVSKNDKNKFFYASLKALATPPAEDAKAASTTEEAKTAPKKEEKKPTQRSVTEQDLFAVAILHTISDQLVLTMNRYANRLATRSMPILGYFSRAQQELSAGVTLLKSELKVDDDRLPEIKF